MASLLTRAATGVVISARLRSFAQISELGKSPFVGSTTFSPLDGSHRQQTKESASFPCLCVLSTMTVTLASTFPRFRLSATTRAKSALSAQCFRLLSTSRAKSTSAAGTNVGPTLNSTFVFGRQQTVGSSAIRCDRLRFTSRCMSNSGSVTVVVKSLHPTFVCRRQRKVATAAVRCCCVHSASTPTSTTTTTTTTTTIVKKGEKQSPKLLMEVFAELELSQVQEMVGGVRVRQHVNPLKASLVAPVAPVKWETVFADCTLPLTVDIGSGPGRLLMVLGKRNAGTQNFLGLDVRWRLVDRANSWADELNLTSNVHFVTANATVAFGSLVATYPGPLEYVFILCPDPHFKRRHQKRRIVQKQLVDAVVYHLKPGGKIYIQSDVKEVAEDMRAEFEKRLGSSLVVADVNGGESNILADRDSEGWVKENPLGVPSEREAHVVATGGRLYRALYKRI